MILKENELNRVAIFRASSGMRYNNCRVVHRDTCIPAHKMLLNVIVETHTAVLGRALVVHINALELRRPFVVEMARTALRTQVYDSVLKQSTSVCSYSSANQRL